MPGQFLSAAERARLERFPQEIAEHDLNTFFTLSAADIAELPSHSAPQHRLGFALQLCALRYLGFSPLALTTAPAGAVAYMGLPYHRGKKQRSALSTLVSCVLFCTFARRRSALPGGP